MFCRYGETDPHLKNFKRPCNHSSKTLNCNSVSRQDIIRQREIFYADANKITQEQKLCKFISVCPVQRKRSRENNGDPKPKSFHTYFYFHTKKNVIPVCKKFIQAALSITKRRIHTVAKTIFDGQIPKEKRGGDRQSVKSVDKKNKVREFICSLPATESHYNRKKSSRIYLACDLNLNKVFQMYNLKYSDYQVSRTMFKNIFYNDFNIGFKSPATDACGTCINLKNAIKKQNGDAKMKSITDLRIHNLRAKEFYKLAKETPPNSISFAFDLQQVHPLPKSPIQDAFYLRQISFYSFCCVDMQSRHPTFFTWTENQAKRGCTEVGSALLYYLRSLDLKDCGTLRLFCDGCGGQNKNSYIIHTLSYWLRESPSELKNIIVHFPVRGHSFLPADRAFGRVEKILKKEETIISSEEYNKIYSEVGNVKVLGRDWCLFDIKSITEGIYNKIPGIKNMKRIEIRKCHIRNNVTIKYKGSEYFRFENNESFQSLVKRGKKEQTFQLKEKDLGNEITKEKKENVKQLLEKMYNNEEKNIKWESLPELQFYKDIIFNPEAEQEVQGERSEDLEEACDCMEPDCTVIHI